MNQLQISLNKNVMASLYTGSFLPYVHAEIKNFMKTINKYQESQMQQGKILFAF